MKQIIHLLLKVKFNTYFGVLLLFFSTLSKAQDIEFSQYNASPLLVNPSFGGMSFAPKVVLHFRDQQFFYNHAFVSLAGTYDQYIDAIHGGIGSSIIADRAGDGIYNQLALYAHYHYRVILKKININIGVQAGILHQAINWGKLRFDDMVILPYGFEDSFGSPTISSQVLPNFTKWWRPDFGTGALLFSKKFFVGIAAQHLTQPKIGAYTEATLARKYNIYAGYQINLDKRRDVFNLTPHLLAVYHGKDVQVNLGVNSQLQNIICGFQFRHTIQNSDALIYMLGYQKDLWKILYSYDMGIARFGNYKYGSHEIALTIQFEESDWAAKRRKQKNDIKCPGFIK